MEYNEISLYRLLQYYGNDNELNTRHHWPTIDPTKEKYGNIKWYVDAAF